jgi:hypothetical protein
MWLGVGISFTMFFVEYSKLWYRGVRLGQKEPKMAFEDLKRNIRRISIAFILYFVISYMMIILFAKGFLDCVARGAVMSAFCFPLVNDHFS